MSNELCGGVGNLTDVDIKVSGEYTYIYADSNAIEFMVINTVMFSTEDRISAIALEICKLDKCRKLGIKVSDIEFVGTVDDNDKMFYVYKVLTNTTADVT